MICERCIHRLSLLPINPSPIIRSFSSSLRRKYPSDPPPATSTSAAQLFSTPFTPSPSKTPTLQPGSTSKPQEPATISKVPAGTPLKGLGYIKGQEAPLAKEDSEYPSWLWGLLRDETSGGDVEAEMGDVFGKSHSLWCVRGAIMPQIAKLAFSAYTAFSNRLKSFYPNLHC